MRKSKMARDMTLTGVERFFEDNEIIVTKTDLKGRITYCNDVFQRMAGFTEQESLGQPHSIIRHPDMPRCVFALLWDTIQAGNEIFAYVVNRAKNGDHYWVYAHVSPSYDRSGNLVGYHSNRRVPDRAIVDNAIVPLYQALLAEEQRHANAKEGMHAATQMVVNLLQEKNMQYDEFVASLAA
jgi:PAS domain S-box-containing protein